MGLVRIARSPRANQERLPTSAEAADASPFSPTLGKVSLEEPSPEAWVGATATTPLSCLRGEGIPHADAPAPLWRLRGLSPCSRQGVCIRREVIHASFEVLRTASFRPPKSWFRDLIG